MTVNEDPCGPRGKGSRGQQELDDALAAPWPDLAQVPALRQRREEREARRLATAREFAAAGAKVMRCAARKRDGSPCQRWPGAGNVYCTSHSEA